MSSAFAGGRVIINFDDTCNMQCPYCYVPFKGIPFKVDRLEQILIRCRELGFAIVTFGGGDPLMYKDFRKVLVQARNLGFEVHVDTNAIGLASDDLDLLNGTVSLLGLPLDGPDPNLHGAMRGSASHFEKVMNALDLIQDGDFRVKINTVLGRPNLSCLSQLQSILNQRQIDIWSIYQFMPLLGAASGLNKHNFEIETCQFLNATSSLSESRYSVEICTASSRLSSYVFVTPQGVVYTHGSQGQVGYEFLGDIFCDDWIVKYSFGKTLRDDARHRYRKLANS